MELTAGKVAVVTGAAGGIGLSLAERFARSGLHVVLADVDEAGVAAAAQQVGALGVETLAVRRPELTAPGAAIEIGQLAIGAEMPLVESGGTAHDSSTWKAVYVLIIRFPGDLNSCVISHPGEATFSPPRRAR